MDTESSEGVLLYTVPERHSHKVEEFFSSLNLLFIDSSPVNVFQLVSSMSTSQPTFYLIMLRLDVSKLIMSSFHLTVTPYKP